MDSIANDVDPEYPRGGDGHHIVTPKNMVSWKLIQATFICRGGVRCKWTNPGLRKCHWRWFGKCFRPTLHIRQPLTYYMSYHRNMKIHPPTPLPHSTSTQSLDWGTHGSTLVRNLKSYRKDQMVPSERYRFTSTLYQLPLTILVLASVRIAVNDTVSDSSVIGTVLEIFK